jgi:phage tail-like protein
MKLRAAFGVAQQHRDQPAAVTITLVSGLGEPLQTWRLRGVVPLSWSIEALDAASAKVAIETLELSDEALAPGTPC